MTAPDLLLDLAHTGLERGRVDPQRLDQAADRLAQSRQKYETQAVGNPETDDDTVQGVLRTFDACQDALDRLRDGTSLEDACQALGQAALALKAEQKAWLTMVRGLGPTQFPDANRVVFHLRVLADGFSDTRYATMALQDLAHIEQRTRADLDAREKRCTFSQSRPQALAAARAIAEIATQAAGSLERADRRSLHDEVAGRLTVQCERLAQALFQYAAAEAESGPTPNPTANGILLAAGAVERGDMDVEDFAIMLGRLEDTLPLDSPFLAPVSDMRRGLLTEGPEAVGPWLEAVASLGQSVRSDGRTTIDEDDEILLDFIHGSEGLHLPSAPPEVMLPGNLQAAVEAVAAFLHQPAAGSEDAERKVESLANRIQATRTVMDRPSVPAADKATLTAGLAVMDEALESLRVALSAQSRPALEAARESLSQAAELLSGLAQRKKR